MPWGGTWTSHQIVRPGPASWDKQPLSSGPTPHLAGDPPPGELPTPLFHPPAEPCTDLGSGQAGLSADADLGTCGLGTSSGFRQPGRHRVAFPGRPRILPRLSPRSPRPQRPIPEGAVCLGASPCCFKRRLSQGQHRRGGPRRRPLPAEHTLSLRLPSRDFKNNLKNHSGGNT